jgi:hypothetical protein
MTELIWKPIEIVYAGRTIAGQYARDGQMLRVQAASCEKTARLGHFPPEILAGILLRELAEDGRVNGRPRETPPGVVPENPIRGFAR